MVQMTQPHSSLLHKANVCYHSHILPV